MCFTGNITLCLGEGLANSLGRKGAESDVTLYNNKTGDCVLSFAEPSSYPEKIQSLSSSLAMSTQAVLRVSKLSPMLAEQAVALDAYGLKTGFIILDEVEEETLKPLLEGSVASGYEFIEGNVVSVREKLAGQKIPSGGEPVVQVDHCFSVKGVGTVALGVVLEGTVEKYSELEIQPNQLKTTVKSIQVHDTDVKQAAAGVRVGLCLKDAKPDECPRGSLLAPQGKITFSESFILECSLSGYSPRQLWEGDNLLLHSCLNYSPAKIASGSLEKDRSGKLGFELEKPLPVYGRRILLMDPGARMPRILGHAKL